jgi:hypothetical protein
VRCDLNAGKMIDEGVHLAIQVSVGPPLASGVPEVPCAAGDSAEHCCSLGRGAGGAINWD